MNRYERLNALLELVAERGKVEVDEIAAELDVSGATVRRDLDHLAGQRLLTRTRGGAVAHSVAYGLPLRYRTVRRAGEKQRIGRVAAGQVGLGAVVGLNGGTTTTEVARALITSADFGGASGDGLITVVTNALNIAGELAVRPQVKLVVTGGVAKPQSYELMSPLAGKILNGLNLDVTFLGVDAIDPDSGAFAHHEGDADIDRMFAERARRVVVVADSSKIRSRAFTEICPIDRVHALVTDSEVGDEDVRRFHDRGVEVIRA